ncbi:AAA family ATPase [Desulfobacter sp.]|uniref:AAA family ATPase n=1 Tax=Desulfobacter sp. TaxID=2294 RepID=UPI003D11C84B
MIEAIQAAIAGKTPNAAGDVRGDCPKCEGKQRDTLGVNTTTGAYHCFRCDFRGNYLKEKRAAKKPMAQFLIEQAIPVGSHPYTEKKQIRPDKILQDKHGNWVLPFQDSEGHLQTIQFINPEGVKNFLGKVKNNNRGFKGAAHIIEGSKDTIIFCEGCATGWSIHHANGAMVFCCGSKGNLDPVLAWAVGKYPDSRKIVAGDNDKSGDGQRVGSAAARKYKVLFACPGTIGDFNDMAIDAGLDAVKNVLDNAVAPGPDDGVKIPDGISASDLLEKVFPDPKWAVKGVLPEGLTILGGKPKAGKSILALNLCLQIALGGKAMQSVPVERGTTLYLALEDVQRRLQDRIGKMLEYDPAPKNLLLFTEWPRLGEGGARALDKVLTDNPDTRLLVIDTLAKIRPPSKSNGNLYSDDYQVIDTVKRLADKHEVAVLIVHHLRKMEGDDVFDTFSGTLGLTGAADSLMVMRRNTAGQMILSLRGRDVEEQEYVLDFDPIMFSWKITGKAVDIKSTDERQKLFDCLKAADGPMTPKQITEATGLDHQYVRKNLPKLCEEGTLKKEGYGKYTYINKGNSGNTCNSCNTGNSGNSCESVADTCPSVAGGDSDRQQFKASNDGALSGSVAIVATVPPECGNNCKYAAYPDEVTL